MNDLTFARLHEHLVAALPELARPVSLLREDEIFSTNGVPSQYGGTSQVLEVYLGVLLALPASPARDAALVRAFRFVEAMLASRDEDLVGFAELQLIEGRAAWWFQRARPFTGPRFEAAARRWQEHGWVAASMPDALGFPPWLRLHDLYEVRPAVATLLAPRASRWQTSRTWRGRRDGHTCGKAAVRVPDAATPRVAGPMVVRRAGSP